MTALLPPSAALGARQLDAPDDLEAVLDMLESNGWTDGLPVIPPTVERVERALRAVGRAPVEELGTVPPRWGVATVGVVVANAIMAGCRPPEIPVVLAAVEAVLRKPYNLYSVQATTGSVGPMIVVSGPIADQLGIHGGSGCLGPGWRANAVVGRALRLVLLNVGGARPGQLDRSTHGQPGKFTSLCVTENLAASPWPALHVERGYAPEQSVAFLMSVMGSADLIDYSSTNAEDLLAMLAGCLGGLGVNHVMFGGYSVLMLGPEHAHMLAQAGYSRADVARQLAARCTVPLADFPATARQMLATKRPRYFGDGPDAARSAQAIPIFDSPAHLQVIVAGGEGPHSAFLPAYGDLTDPQAVVIC
jgi:hypothetical protein